MPLSLDDVMNAPTDPELLNKHLQTLGYLQPPPEPPPVKIAPMSPVTSAAAEPSPLKPMSPLTPRGADMGLSATNRPDQFNVGNDEMMGAAAPEMGTPSSGGGSLPIKPMTPPDLTSKEKLALPLMSSGIPNIGSSQYTANELERLEEKKNADTLDSHPGLGGKIGHVLSRIGNVAGNVLAPGIMETIPGTDLNRMGEEHSLKRELASRTAAEGQAANQRSEADLRSAQAKNLASEVSERENKNEQSLEKDAAGNVVGYRDKTGLHSIDDAPDDIKKIAEEEKSAPRYETDKVTGNIVKLSTDKDGKTSSEVVYKGTPNQKTETRSIVGADGHAHDQVIDLTPGSPTFGKSIADLGRAKEDKQPSAANEIAKSKADERLVIGYDDKGNMHLVPKAQADEMKLNHVGQATTGDRKDAENNISALNELGVKTRALNGTLKALDQNPFQRGIIAFAMSHDTGGTADQLMKAAALSGASQDTQDFIIAAHNVREAALNLPKIMTGSARMTEVQAQALWKTVADGASKDSKYAEKQLQAFDQMTGRMWKKVPHVEGNEREYAFPEQHKGEYGQAGGGEKTEVAPPPEGKTAVYDTKGETHYVKTEKLDQFLKDPKYQGWSKNAPK